MAKIDSEFIVTGDLHTRVNRRMLDDHKEDHRDNGLSLDLQLKPPSVAEEGPVNVVPTPLNGSRMVLLRDQLPMLSLVNDGQRPPVNGVLELLGGRLNAPVDPPPSANANAGVDNNNTLALLPANVMVQHRPVLSLINGRVNGGQRPVMNAGLRLMQRRPPPRAANGNAEVAAESRPRGRKRSHRQSDKQKKEKPATITPPYPWSTDRRAKVHSIKTLLNKGITFCSGDVQCRHCEQTSTLKLPLVEKFSKLWNYVCTNREDMHERAPHKWLQPSFPTCTNCGHENSLKPIIASNKRNINWLFLLLGETLGCCSLDQLKYFCKHTVNHRTGAKNRVLYLTYLTLCHQLNPDSPFQR